MNLLDDDRFPASAEWLRFAVVNAAADPQAIVRFYELGGGDAFPLFAGTEFASQAETGPWFLPCPPDAFIDGYQEGLAGFFGMSTSTMETVRTHWQSLNQVAYEGEILWFRYADPKVLAPMMMNLSANEIDALLGPCEVIQIQAEVGWQHWRRQLNADFSPQPAPWWRVQPHHLAVLYDENRHAYILRRRFWQTMTGMMELHQDPKDAILPVLKAANLASLQGDVLDGVVAGALTLQVGLPLDGIRSPLMLTDDEMSQVANWLHKYQAKTGVS